MSINTNSVTAYSVTTYFELSWTEQIDLASNKSILDLTVITHQNPTGSGYQRTINANGSIVVVNGTTYNISGQKTYDGKVIWTTSGIEIEHNQDGTKTITASLKVNVGGDYVSGSGNIELTTILRNSTVEVSPALLTSGNETVTIKPYVESYTHTVTYKVNDTTVTLATKTTQTELSIAYDDLKAIIGDYRSADVVVSVTTFNGDDELGTNTASFLVQTGKIPFSLYDDKNGNVGVGLGEQATQSGVRSALPIYVNTVEDDSRMTVANLTSDKSVSVKADKADNNHGLYSDSQSEWLIYHNGEENGVVGGSKFIQAWNGVCRSGSAITCNIPLTAKIVVMYWKIGDYWSCLTMYRGATGKHIVSDETNYAGGQISYNGETMTYTGTAQNNNNCYLGEIWYKNS